MSKEVGEEGQGCKDYVDPPPATFIDMVELKSWSFSRTIITEFIATLIFLYVAVATVIGHKKQTDVCGGVGLLGIAWDFGGMIFILVYCTVGISGGHINPAVTFGLFLARKVSLPRVVAYMVFQSLGAICGVGLVKAFMKNDYNSLGGGANTVATSYNKGTAVRADIIGIFVLVYTVFLATDPKRSARDSHVPVLAPLPIEFTVFIVHLATIPIIGTVINPARSFSVVVIYNTEKAWDDHWIFWVGPMVGALAAAVYHQFILRAGDVKALMSNLGFPFATTLTSWHLRRKSKYEQPESGYGRKSEYKQPESGYGRKLEYEQPESGYGRKPEQCQPERGLLDRRSVFL